MKNKKHKTTGNHQTLIKWMCLAAALFITAFWAGGCSDLSSGILVEGENTNNNPTAFAPVAITITGIGTDKMAASARPAGSNVAANLSNPFGSAGPNDGTIQLKPIENGSFTFGERTSGGVRYIYASFKVRNANIDGNPYPNIRQNLTFFAVDNAATFGITAVATLRLFDGTELSGATAQAIAEKVIPTGRVEVTANGDFVPVAADVMQVVTENEANTISVPAGVEVFPYGFVTRSPGAVTPGSRALPASPPPNYFTGVVTFAFKIPLQASDAQDPFEITMLFVPVDDSDTRLTEPPELQNTESGVSITERIEELDAEYVTIFPGSPYQGIFFLPGETRIAGPQGSPTTTLFQYMAMFASITPASHLPVRSHITSPVSFALTYSQPTDGFDDPRSVVVRGRQTGRHFVGQAYSVAGNTITTPSTSFFPGEKVQVSITPVIGAYPRVSTYRVAATGGNGTFVETMSSPFPVVNPCCEDVDLGDIDEDGDLDMVTINGDNNPPIFNQIRVRVNDGFGNFGAGMGPFTILGDTPSAIELADVNGDGHLDAITANNNSQNVSVLLGDGNGSFNGAINSPYNAGAYPIDMVVGDLNGDGATDIVTLNFFPASAEEVSILYGDGTGGFELGLNSPISIGSDGIDIAIGNTLIGTSDLDILVTGTTGLDRLYIIYPTPPVFVPGFDTEAAGTAKSLAAGDLDSDGNLDIVVIDAAANYDAKILENVGSGNYTVGGSYLVTAIGFTSIELTLGDVNADGNLDIVASSRDEDMVYVLTGNGDLTFDAAVGIPLGGSASPTAVILGDVDGNGSLDIITGNFIDHSISVLLNQ